jgi:hypothetical protein
VERREDMRGVKMGEEKRREVGRRYNTVGDTEGKQKSNRAGKKLAEPSRRTTNKEQQRITNKQYLQPVGDRHVVRHAAV